MHPISQLILKYNRREINPEETKELLAWVAELPERQELFASLTQSAPLEEQLRQYMDYEEERLLDRLNRLRQDGVPPDARVLYTRTRRRRWILAAAALFFVIGVGGYWFSLHKPISTARVQQPVLPKMDVAPGGNKAILTLAGGRQIVLDSAANGLLAEQGNALVKKLADGRLAYSATDKESAVITYNVLSTPRGGQYNVLLPDGTQVWLNAASSITYPTAFSGTERRVTISGEAYFDVTTDPGKPFLVQVNGLEVRVLGTQFNINAYADEPGIQATLLKGSVLVSGPGHRVKLQPGQQAQAINGTLSVLPSPDLEQVMAWKNGLFKFNGTPITEIMRQVQRWYDVDIEYHGQVQQLTFSGKIPRRDYASQVLKMLEETGGAHFFIEGKTIKVTP